MSLKFKKFNHIITDQHSAEEALLKAFAEGGHTFQRPLVHKYDTGLELNL